MNGSKRPAPETRLMSLLSLAMKAGKMQTGETAVEKGLQNGTALLVLVATDASDNTKKKFTNKCFYYKKPILITGTKESLSRCVGKNNRSVFTVTDAHFAKGIQSIIET
jgi:ribosomal protein L7Ae-like RNA K-turn-binding protein